MNNTQAVVNTGAAAFGVAQVSDILQWMIDGFHNPVPDNVTMALAALLLPLGHAFYVWLDSRLTPKGTP